MKNGSCTTGCGSVWLECTAGGREVAGSNPVAPMLKPLVNQEVFNFVLHKGVGCKNRSQECAWCDKKKMFNKV